MLNLLMALRGSFDFVLHAGNMAIADANQVWPCILCTLINIHAHESK